MYYLKINKETYDVEGAIGEEEAMKKLGMNRSQFMRFLDSGKLFDQNHFLIEKEYAFHKNSEEYYCLFDESKYKLWYVSNYGNVITKFKTTGQESPIALGKDARGNISFRANGKSHTLKNMVAKYFLKDWEPKCLVSVIDLNQPVTADNLKIISKKERFRKLQHDRNCIKVELLENEKPIKRWNSITECAKELYYEPSTLAKLLKNNKIKNLRIAQKENSYE